MQLQLELHFLLTDRARRVFRGLDFVPRFFPKSANHMFLISVTSLPWEHEMVFDEPEEDDDDELEDF